MHVAIFGAGALGAAYGVRLAVRAKASVTFVVRPARVASRAPISIERVKDDLRETIEEPNRAALVPPDADIVLLAVGTEDLDAIRAPLEGSEAPIVIVTPMLPKEWQRVRASFGERALAAMPSFVSYARKDGVFRYWLPPVPTRIDEPRAGERAEAVRALARDLAIAGIETHLELGVHETNPATTVCVIPVGMALAVAGSLEAFAADDVLVRLASRACAEGVAIARTIGAPEPPVLLAPFFTRPSAMRAASAALRRLSPEGLFYLEEHFGRKLRAQHLVMAREMAALAGERGLAREAIDDLAARLALVRAPSSA